VGWPLSLGRGRTNHLPLTCSPADSGNSTRAAWQVTVVDKPDDNTVYFDRDDQKGANQLKDPVFVKVLQDLGEFGKEIQPGW